MQNLSIRVNADMLQDRETRLLYAVHDGACRAAFDAAMEAAGVSVLERFAPMGPTLLADGETCNWGQCRKGGE